MQLGPPTRFSQGATFLAPAGCVHVCCPPFLPSVCFLQRTPSASEGKRPHLLMSHPKQPYTSRSGLSARKRSRIAANFTSCGLQSFYLEKQNCIWFCHYSDALILSSCLTGKNYNKDFFIFTKNWQREVSQSGEMAPERPVA